MSEELSFPYRLYPTNPFFNTIDSPYINPKYNLESMRLYEFIIQINSNQLYENTLNVFIIGSIIDDDPPTDMFGPAHQFWQHCPYFLLDYLKENKRKNLTRPVRIIVISPSLSTDKPVFIEKSNLIYKWQQPDSNILSFTSENYPNLSYNFFNCPMPEYVKEDFLLTPNKINLVLSGTTKRLPIFFFNKTFYKNMLNIDESKKKFTIKRNSSYNESKEIMRQALTNDTDIEFINNFYQELDTLINSTISNNGANLCLNYAVFREGRVESDYFMKRFSTLFTEKVLILSYVWNNRIGYELVDTHSKVYLYNNTNLKLELIGEPKYIRIYDKNNEVRYSVEQQQEPKQEERPDQ